MPAPCPSCAGPCSRSSPPAWPSAAYSVQARSPPLRSSSRYGRVRTRLHRRHPLRGPVAGAGRLPACHTRNAGRAASRRPDRGAGGDRTGRMVPRGVPARRLYPPRRVVDLMWEGISVGLATALDPANLAWVVVGCLAGTLIGMLPGLGPITAIALMIPVSYSMDPAAGLIMMAGVYYGAVFGGSTSSILINAPGVASTVATSFDGYPMARAGGGRAGARHRGLRFVHGRTCSAPSRCCSSPGFSRSGPPHSSPRTTPSS